MGITTVGLDLAENVFQVHAYHTGWDDGFATCKGQYESVQRFMR
jgi:hypothetical protein